MRPSKRDRRAAQVVAAECVVEAETKDHLNATGKALKEAHEKVEEQGRAKKLRGQMRKAS